MTIPATIPTSVVPGWYALKFDNGTVGLQKIQSSKALPSNVIERKYIGTYSLSFPDLVNPKKVLLSPVAAITQLGATAKQRVSLIAQLDAGAGQDAETQWLYIGPGSKPQITSNVDTSLRGDVTDVSISLPKVHLPEAWKLFTSMAFWKGLGLVLAGAGILIFAAVEISKLTGTNVPIAKIVRSVK